MDAAPFFHDVAGGPPDVRSVWLRAADGVRLRAVHWPAAGRGTVLVLPGRTECVEKYARLAADLVAAGYHVVSLDERGQGLSDRLLPDRLMGHVGRFADYQLDLAALAPLIDPLPGPRYLIGHSMGAAIGLRAVIERYPVRAAAFTGPMWGIRVTPGLDPVALPLATLAVRAGLRHRYAPTTGPWTYALRAPFEDNTLTGDRTMWDWMRAQLTAHPELALGGPSWHWLREALAEIRWLLAQPAARVPILAILGSAERIVETGRVRRRVASWPGAQLLLLPGGEHEVLMERPDLRREAMAAILQLFAAAA